MRQGKKVGLRVGIKVGIRAVPKQTGAQGFYKVWVSDAPIVAECAEDWEAHGACADMIYYASTK